MLVTPLINWLIERMGWVYRLVTQTLGLPSFVGYVVLGALAALFVYELYDIYAHRYAGKEAMIWLLIVLLVPLGTLIYLAFGYKMLRQSPRHIAYAKAAKQKNNIKPKHVATVLGSIVGVIAAITGTIAVLFFIFVGIALVQCSNDPKCM